MELKYYVSVTQNKIIRPYSYYSKNNNKTCLWISFSKKELVPGI